MKAVLISIRPKWCEKIVNGEKTIEVRKTRPKQNPPLKVYIYCTKDAKKQFWTGPKYSYADDHSHNAFDKCGSGKVIGEFLCNQIIEDHTFGLNEKFYTAACMSACDAAAYALQSPMYGWNISGLKIYDTPKELSAFYRTCPGLNDVGMCWTCDKAVGEEHDCRVNGEVHLSRPPQSWCYVYENN